MAKSRRAKSRSGREKSGTQHKLEQIRREQRRRATRIRVLAGVGAAVAVAAIATGIALAAGGGDGSGGSGGGGGGANSSSAGGTTSGPLGAEGIALETGPALAPVSTSATGQPVDGISCNTKEQAVSHIHAHLAVYVNGAARQIPLGIGAAQPSISQTARGPFASATHCYYWLHTHASDGIIHVESPIQHTYTLGDFFDIWRQPLNGHQAGTATSTVTAYVNGAKYSGNPRSIPLTSRAAIQLNVGEQVAPASVDWSKSQL